MGFVFIHGFLDLFTYKLTKFDVLNPWKGVLPVNVHINTDWNGHRSPFMNSASTSSYYLYCQEWKIEEHISTRELILKHREKYIFVLCQIQVIPSIWLDETNTFRFWHLTTGLIFRGYMSRGFSWLYTVHESLYRSPWGCILPHKGTGVIVNATIWWYSPELPCTLAIHL